MVDDLMLKSRKTARTLTSRSRGFTIIELMMVVVILVILISIAGPDFRNIIIATRIKNVSFDVFSTLTQARSEAITRNTTVTITPDSGGWAKGWTISCTDATVCKNPATNTPPLTIRQQNAYDGVTVTNSATSVSFNGMGRANAAVSFAISAPNASDRNKRCVTLDASGRPVTKPVVTSGFTCP